MYSALRHFQHFMEGREFTGHINRKPLKFSLISFSDTFSRQESRQLDYISDFTPDAQHIFGEINVVADSLS